MEKCRPNKSIQKILISTPSKLIGEYYSDDLLIAHAFPNHVYHYEITQYETPFRKNCFVLAFETPPREYNDIDAPDYRGIGEVVCSYLAVLYGKRFDNHGVIEGDGIFQIPLMNSFASLANPMFPQHNSRPRSDIQIKLDLEEFSKIRPLLDKDDQERFIVIFNAASRFYLQALQTVESNPETAYMHLITSGEILSNYYKYEQNDLFDGEITGIFSIIENGLDDGSRIVKQIKNRLFQVRRKFVKTMMLLINDHFFTNSESKRDYTQLRKDGIERRIAAAYDLRSRYVHTGIEFGDWIKHDGLYDGQDISEVLDGTPELNDRKLVKLLELAPTYFGLERIVRFCLLRFIHREVGNINSKLE